jgi:hypothetical protein
MKQKHQSELFDPSPFTSVQKFRGQLIEQALITSYLQSIPKFPLCPFLIDSSLARLLCIRFSRNAELKLSFAMLRQSL